MLSNEVTFTLHPHYQWKADVNLRSGHTIFKMLSYAINCNEGPWPQGVLCNVLKKLLPCDF